MEKIFITKVNNLFKFENVTSEVAIKTLSYLFVLKKIGFIKDLINSECVKDKLALLWDNELSTNSEFNHIFLDKFDDVISEDTYKKLIKLITNFELSTCEKDIIGILYESVFINSFTKKKLGQYFTQPIVKNLMIDLVNPSIINKRIETICDPSMGTGGFLLSYINKIKEKAISEKVEISDEVISKSIYGKEINKLTYILAESNLFLNGVNGSNIELGDSIYDPLKEKYDIILANPPFGTKGIKYELIKNKSYFPIQTNNIVHLFIQLVVNLLNDNGRCAIVLPFGGEITSQKINKSVLVRKYLTTECTIKEVIFLPENIFLKTDVKTVILFFEKKKSESSDLIDFYEFNGKEKTKLVSVPMSRIEENNYSLSFKEYYNNTETKKDFFLIKDVCSFSPRSKLLAKDGKDNGEFNFYTSSQLVIKKCDKYDYEDYHIIVGEGGIANIKYGNKFSCSVHNHLLTCENKILLKYIYYYLSNNMEILQFGFDGIGPKHIKQEYLENIKIPKISDCQQKEIVEYIDIASSFISSLESKISNQKKFISDKIKALDK